MSGEAAVLNLLEKQREENHRQFASLRESNKVVADAVATLTTTMARFEERHHGHNAGMKRMGSQVDDHETRIRKVETNAAKAIGGAMVISFAIPFILKALGV